MNGTPRRRGAPLAGHIADVAARLFYSRGIHVVGVDLIAGTAGVTKRTLYRHFASKDVLIAASLTRGPWIVFPEHGTPRAMILGAFDALIAFVSDPAYRGCPHINAAVELSAPAHPARTIAEEHATRRRSWFHGRLAGGGIPGAEDLAEQLDVIFDGALANATKRRTPRPAHAARAAVETLLDAHAVT